MTLLTGMQDVKPLPQSFYRRPAPMVAWDLLGKIIVHKTPEGIFGAKIVETEAYLGKDDKAAHASHGETERNRVFYENEPGSAYVFQCHGKNFLFNVLTSGNKPLECVLVRSGEPIIGVEKMRYKNPRKEHELTNGPAKLSRALRINRSINGKSLVEGPVMILGTKANGYSKGVSARVGISRDRTYPLRNYIVNSKYVSRSPKRRY